MMMVISPVNRGMGNECVVPSRLRSSNDVNDDMTVADHIPSQHTKEGPQWPQLGFLGKHGSMLILWKINEGPLHFLLCTIVGGTPTLRDCAI